MGDIIEYKCTNCGFQSCYRTGGGFLTDDYWEESKRLENELRNEVVEGQYGDVIQEVIKIKGDKLKFDCGETVYQCRACKFINIERNKSIRVVRELFDDRYDMFFNVKQKCPSCGSGAWYEDIGIDPICPECKTTVLQIERIGKWD